MDGDDMAESVDWGHSHWLSRCHGALTGVGGWLKEWEERDRGVEMWIEGELSEGCGVWGRRGPGRVRQNGNGGITVSRRMGCQEPRGQLDSRSLLDMLTSQGMASRGEAGSRGVGFSADEKEGPGEQQDLQDPWGVMRRGE